MTGVLPKTIVFIDSRVPDLQALIDGAQPGEMVFVLDAQTDGVQQIADILAANNFNDLDAIHIVSHGTVGQVQLGSTFLNDGDLAEHSAALATIGSYLAANGDLLLYGCDVAAGDAGKQFIADLSSYTGADVAAATHDVGSAALGGSWTLDASTGPIEATAPFTADALTSFDSVLAGTIDGQLWYTILDVPGPGVGAPPGTPARSVAGHLNSDGTSVTPDGALLDNSTVKTGYAMGVDTAARLLFVANTDHLTVSVYNLNTDTLIQTLQVGNANAGGSADDDIVDALAVDPINHMVFVNRFDGTSTGIVKISYDPLTGLLNSNGAYNSGSQQFLITNAGTTAAYDGTHGYTNATDIDIDIATHKLYYTDWDDTFTGSFGGANFVPTNAIYVVSDYTAASPTVTRLTTLAQFPADGSGGYLGNIAVDDAKGLIYFTVSDFTNAAGGQAHLYYMPIAGGTATKIFDIDNVHLGDSVPAGLSIDPQSQQLYVSLAYNASGTVAPTANANHVLQYDISADGHTLTLVRSYTMTQLEGQDPTDNGSHPGASIFNQLPTLTLTGTLTHIGEQSGTFLDLTQSNTSSDTDGGYYSGATVQITGGTFVANETSASDDHLSVNDSGTHKTTGTFSGTSITISYDSASETLTLSGYDTIAHYNTVLAAVEYQTTGDNPTDYGLQNTRTVTWTVSDGSQNIPTGNQNSATSTFTIDAVDDPPVNHLPATPSVNEDVLTTISGITITDVDADPANQDITATFSVVHGTLTFNTAVAGGITGADITGGANGSNTVTLTATQNQINATLTSGTGFRYQSDLNFNSGFGTETLHIVTSDLGHTGSGGPLTDTDDLGITVNAVNDNPNLQPDTTTAVSYTENAAPTALFSGENVDTPLADVDQSANYATGSIDLNITAGAVTGDRISLTGATFHISGGNVQDSGNVNIGAISGNGTSHVTVSALTSAATPSVVDALIQSFGFDSTSDNPGSGDRTITLTFNDGGNTGSGGALTDAVTQTEHVTPVNDAPVATTPVAHYTATEQVNLNLHGTGLSVSDVDGNSGNETVTLSVGEGTITLSAGNSGVGSISGSGTSSLTFSGTLTQLNALLSGSSTGTLIYNDPSDTPVASTTLTLLVHDNGNTGTGGDLFNSANATIDITAVNDAPVATMTTDPYAATEQVALDIKNTGMTVSDVDALGAVEVATLSVTQGVLNITAGTSGVTVGTNGTSSVTLTGTLAQINDLLSTNGTSTVSYTETNDNPAATVTLQLQINDQGNTGTGGAHTGTDTSTINITAVNDAPVATTPVAHYTATEQVNLNLHGTGLSVSDVDGNSGNETVTLSVGEGTITLSAGNSGVGSISGSGTSSLTFSGTLTQLNALLSGSSTGTLIYNDPSDTPVASTTLTLLVHDNGNTGTGGDLFNSANATIDITAVNDAPNASMTTDPYAATEQTTLNLKNTGMTVSDVDALGANETATLSVGEGTLHVDAGSSGAVVSGDNTSSVTLTGTLAQINALLNTDGTSVVSYIDNTDNPSASANLTLQIDDGGATGTGGAHTGSDTSTINITAVNDAPVSTITPTSYGGSPNVAINLKNNGLSVSDVDGNAGSETVTLSTTPDGTLTVTAGGSGAIVSNSGTSSVTITGTIAQIDALLNTDGTSTVSFIDAVGGTKTLTLLIHDNGNTGGGDLSAQDTANIVLDNPPVVDLNGATAGTGSTLNYTENAAASAIAPTGTATDTDSTDFNTGSLRVHFSANGAAEDQLSILTDGTVTVSSGTVSVGGLAIGTVSGGANGTDLLISFNTTDATPSSVSTLIEHIGYADNSDNPSTAARSVLFTVDDGDGASGSDTATINITPVNDAPVATITPTTYSATEQTSLNLKNTGMSVSDVDGNAGSETVTLSVAEGTLTVTAGGSGAIVNNSGTASVTISGTLAQINALLNTDGTSTVSYIDNTDDPSASALLTLAINDNGNTGGGNLTANDTATINIAAVNDAPGLANVPATADYTENAAPVLFSAPFPNQILITDPDPVPHGAPGGNGLILMATAKIASGFVAGDRLLVDDTSDAPGPQTSGFYTGINVQWDYDATTHILSLFSADPPTNSGDTMIDFDHVLDNVYFDSTSDDPTNGGANTTRTIEWQVQDKGGTANGGTDLSAIYTTTLTVHPINDAPAATITPTSYSATEQVSLSLKSNGIAVSDVDGGSGSETVTLSVGEGVLNVTAGGSGAGVAGSGTNSVTITGSVAEINALLNTDGTSTVGYIDNTDTPGASTTLTLLIHDNGNTGTGGDLSSSDTATINIAAVNDPPVLNGFGDVSSFIENGSSVVLDTNQNSTVSDAELNVSPNNFLGATLTIARHGGANSDDAFAGTGSLDLVDVNGNGENVSLDGGSTFIGTFTNPGDGSVSFTFNANAHAADIASVMHQIVFANASDNPPASEQIDFTFTDGNGDPGGQPQGTGATPGTAVGSFTVNVTQVDDPPALSNVAVAASYSPGSPGAILSPGLAVFDPDAVPPSPNVGLASATITITAGFLAGDQLFVNLPNSGGFFVVDDGAGPVTSNISVQSNAGGQLIVSGTDSVLHYQDVLDAVSYHSSAADPTNGGADQTRTINWKVSDGILDNQAPNPPLYPETTLGFNAAPTVDLDGSTAGTGFVTTFTENGTPIPVVHSDVSIADPDDSSIFSATIVLTNAKSGDALSIAGALPAGISSSIDTSVAGQIKVNLFDSATLADYQTALGQIRFVNTSDLPNTTDRDITVEVTNSNDSNIAHATVHVVSVNDAPVNTVPGPQSVNEDTNLAIAGLGVSDVDAAGGTLTTALSVAHGTLTVASAGGAGVSGSGTGSVTLTGTLTQINTTLSASNNVLYRGVQDFNGGDVLTVVTNDGGNTGTGGPLSDTDTVAITVNAVNDPPVFAHFGATHTSATEQTFVGLNPAATVSDVELDAANGGAGNYAGASLIIGRAGSGVPNPDDTFAFGGAGMTFTVDTVNHVLLASGQQFATYNIPSSGSLAGTIAVNFNSLNTPATSALVNNVLEHITYENLSDTPPASVTMHYTFHDGNTGAQGSGGDGIDTANRIVDITAVNDPPVLAGVAAHVVLPPGGGALTLSPGLTVSDVDSATLASATVHVSAGTFAGDGDVLAVTADGLAGTSISASYDAATETLTLSGTDSLAHYQQALDHVTLQTTIGNPSNGGLDPARTVDWQVNDGSAANNLSNIASTTVDVPKGLPQNDFNGDGQSDILWQNNDGTPAIWLLNGTSLISGNNVGFNPDAGFNAGGTGGGGTGQSGGQTGQGGTPAALPWHEVGSGDFNGDGKSEILWQNTNGTVAEWIVNGTSLVSGGNVAFNPGASWHAIGTGDFNGDGKADILWQNDNGQAAVWLMDGLNILSGANVGINPGSSWHVIGAGDFDGDGKSDILWQNDSGQAAVWLMNGTSLVSGANVGPNPGASWNVEAAGDFNGDGKADILWQNDDGTPAVWLMNGQSLISGANVGFNPGAAWKVHTAGDFNGDGKADILWQNDDGTPAVWLMNGQSLISGANVATDPGTPWHVIPLHHDLLV